ncbi:MAG: hypothetical protein SOR56_09235 [Oscillospiraceae bacterium]|nr:hypothetical protein [Oscillospiraceae bacterium]
MNEEIKREKLRYSVSRKNFFVKLSAFFMLLSMLCRLLGYWGFWANQTSDFVLTQILLPVMCNLLFVVVILYMGRRFFALSCVPVILGVVFFIIKALGFDSVIHMILCICLYLAVAIIYTATVFGVIRTKWLLAPLFGLPLLYHIFVDDLSTLRADENAMSLGEWLPEISVLCIMLSLLLICFAMKKRDFAAERASSEEQQTIDILMENEEPADGKPEDDKTTGEA